MESTVPASRREFLKTSSLAAATLAAGQLAVQQAAHASGDDVIKVGLIGAGGRGTGAAKDALSSEYNVKITAIGDVFENRAKGAADNIRNGVGDKAKRVTVTPETTFVGFDAYQKVIDSGVDLVILATPPGFRPIHFEYAVKAGKHVFMEKPVAVDAPGVRQVLEANKIAKEKKLKVGVGLQRHHQASYLETIARIKDGAIGEVIALRAYWNNPGVWDPPLSWEKKTSEMEYQLRNWYYYVWLSGDHICEQHIHNIDVCNWVMGDHPIRCNGMGGRQFRTHPKYGEIYDHHFVEFEYKSGARMYSQCRHIPNCWNSVSEFAHGSKGNADVSGGKILVPGAEWSYRGKATGPYQQEHIDLQTAIRNGTEYNEGDNGAHSTMTSIMGRMATYSGQPLNYEDCLNSSINLMPKVFAFDAEPPVKADANGVYKVPMPGITKVL